MSTINSIDVIYIVLMLYNNICIVETLALMHIMTTHYKIHLEVLHLAYTCIQFNTSLNEVLCADNFTLMHGYNYMYIMQSLKQTNCDCVAAIYIVST